MSTPPVIKPDNLANEREEALKILNECIEVHNNNRKAAINRLHEICEGMKARIDELENKVTKELDEIFTKEDTRLKNTFNSFKMSTSAVNADVHNEIQKATTEFLVMQSYEVTEGNAAKGHEPSFDFMKMYEPKIEKYVVPELLKMKKLTNVHVVNISKNKIISIEFTDFIPEDSNIMTEINAKTQIKYKCSVANKTTDKNNRREYLLEKTDNSFSFALDNIDAGATYGIKVKMALDDKESEWSDEVEFTTETENLWAWKECPDDVNSNKKYSVDENNHRVATMSNNNYSFYTLCTIIGNATLSLNKVISWNIEIVKSKHDNGYGINIGVAPFDINLNEDNCNTCGWYFNCYDSTLDSGPPHYYKGKEYGPRKKDGEYVHTGDNVGVIMDTSKGILSFVLNGVNLDVAYEGIPLDNPLVPCVLLHCNEDSIKLGNPEMKEIIDDSVPVPSNITIESVTWDSITLTWDTVEGASFYQIEVDESKDLNESTTNSFIKRGFLPETEHSFRVRTVKDNAIGNWSDIIKRTTIEKSFNDSCWKECPDGADERRNYKVDENNPRIATNLGNDYCTIIGNVHVPLNKVTSWSIKILKSKKNDSNGISIGVAPSDIDQNDSDNYYKCGWYLDCYDSTLYSGPPHNYRNKPYGPRGENGKYVHTGDSVGVVVDTTKGNLSFIVNGVNYGVAFKEIPLDKPLVPCAILISRDDSVKLDTSETKEKVDSSIPVPSNFTAKSVSWDSITITWDDVEWASQYQVEIDGDKLFDTSINVFTETRLLPEIEHSYRVRAICGNSVSEWSEAVKGRTQNITEISEYVWKECPNDINLSLMYSVNEKNTKIATKIGDNDLHCTIIGNLPVPPDRVAMWSIKLLKSKRNDGGDIFIGVAPFDIDQSKENNYENCGWYLCCYDSKLRSGPPYYYKYKEYGPKGKNGEYAHTGDKICVIMNTLKGELSFALNGANLGVAFRGIPLDKPLVPCVILGKKGDSVRIELLDPTSSCLIS